MIRFIREKVIGMFQIGGTDQTYKKVDSSEQPDIESGISSNNMNRMTPTQFDYCSNCIKIDISNMSNNPIEMFKIGFSLLDAKLLFVVIILLSEGIGMISTWALINKKFMLVIISSIISSIIGLMVQDHMIKVHYQICELWKKTVYEYFTTLSYPSRKKCEMSDFKSQVERTGWALENIVTRGFPTLVKLLMIFSSCLYAFINQEQSYFTGMSLWVFGICFIGTIGLFIGLYYFFRMKHKQENLTVLRNEKKDIEKKVRPIGMWNLHLFQNRKKTSSEIIGIEFPIMIAEMLYIRGWEFITKELCIFVEVITGFILYCISSDFVSLITNKVIFNQLINSIENIGFLTNCIANDSKEFDRFIDWVKSSDIDPMIIQKDIKYYM